MKIMRCLTLLTLALASSCALAQADGSRRWPVSADFVFVQSKLCRSNGFMAINSLAELPAPFRSKLTNMADRGEPYNETDVIDKPAPTQRFIIGATNGELMLLAIDVGGFAPQKRLDTYFLQSGEWTPTLAKDVYMERKDYANLAQLLAEARKVFECAPAARQ
jgi:hypothetical protein